MTRFKPKRVKYISKTINVDGDSLISSNGQITTRSKKVHELNGTIGRQISSVPQLESNQISKLSEDLKSSSMHRKKSSKEKLNDRKNSIYSQQKKENYHLVESNGKSTFNGKYRLETDERCLLRLESERKALNLVYTDDHDLRDLVKYINEDSSSWTTIMDENKIKIHRRIMEYSTALMVKAVCEIDNVTKEEVFEAIYNIQYRLHWDKVFREFKVVDVNPEDGSEILYMSIKVSPFI